MSERATGGKARCAARTGRRARAFTFVEVIVALAIASISLLTLLKLNLLSIGLVDRAQITTQAVLLANEKIAETLAAGYSEPGRESGTVERNGTKLTWHARVEDVQLPQLEESHITGQRRVVVDVNWKRGAPGKRVRMSTCVADGRLP